MRCYQYKEREAAAFCKDCGRALCPECARQYTSLVCNPCNYANAARAKKGILLHWGRLLLGFAFGCWFFGMDAAIELHAVIGYMFMALVETLYVWNERDLMLGALVSSYAIVNMIFFPLRFAWNFLLLPYRLLRDVRSFCFNTNVQKLVRRNERRG